MNSNFFLSSYDRLILACVIWFRLPDSGSISLFTAPARFGNSPPSGQQQFSVQAIYEHIPNQPMGKYIIES